jgi:hypothetical protein
VHDGRWQIEQLRRVDSTAPVIVGRTAGGPGATVLAGVSDTEPRTVPAMHGAGYLLPLDEPLNETAIGTDLDAVERLGLDTVRVPLPYAGLGADAVDAEKLRTVRRFLDLAAERDIKVVPVLFSGLAQLDPTMWAATDMHLRTVVEALRDHRAIAMWDIADAPDRRATGAGGSMEVYAWVVHTVTRLREADPDRPATVSWADVTAAASPSVNGLFDAVSLAWEGPSSALAPALAQVARNGAGRPLLLSRYGIGTHNGVLPGGHTEQEQAFDVRQTRLIAGRSGVRGTMFAWLRDSMTTQTGSRLPWRAAAHQAEGLLHADGTAKAAAALVGAQANLGKPTRPSVVDPLRKPFWWLVGMVSATVLLGGMIWIRRRRAARSRLRGGTEH